jgi:outer membrane protein assembly factor BamB
VKYPRTLAAGLLLLVATTLTACGGVQNPEGWAGPAVDGNTVYYFPAKNRLSAVSLSDEGAATRLWNFPDKQKPEQKDLKFEAVYDDPAFDGETLYFGTWDGHVFAVTAKDGSLRWAYPGKVDGGIVGGPVLAGDRLVFGTTDKRLYALDKTTGKPADGWPSHGLAMTNAVWAPPVFANGVLYVATMGGEIEALNPADGTRKWDRPFSVQGAIGELALLDDQHLFVPTLDKTVYIVDTATGQAPNPPLKTTGWVWTRPAYRDHIAYFGDFSGNVYALDITTGQSPWSAPYAADNKLKAAPILTGDVLIVADRKPVIHFISAKDGTLINRVPLTDAGTVRAPLTVRGDKGLLTTTKGKLFLADPKTGKVERLLVAGEKP